MTKFINRLDNNTIAYNQLIGKNAGIVFLSGFNSDMQGKKALYLEKWAKQNNQISKSCDYFLLPIFLYIMLFYLAYLS